MFKRVERRLKRKERVDELGLDEDITDVFGLNDTDSDESDSDSDDGGSSPKDSDGGEDIGGEHELQTSRADESEGDEDDENTERALIAVSEALNNPVFIVSLDPDIRECIICPGRLLKGSTMAEKHKSSNAHERRFKHFQKLAASVNPKTNAHKLVEQSMGKKVPQTADLSESSKRAEKKRISREKRSAKRQKFKARQTAKKEALAKADPAEPQKKSPGDLKGDKIKAPAVKKTGKKKVAVTSSDGTPAQPVEVEKHRKREAHDVSEPPKKKQKTSISLDIASSSATVSPATRNSNKSKFVPPPATKSKPKPKSEHEDSTEVIQELQSQVKDIIKSASTLAKAARARALSGDGDGEDQSPKRKKPVLAKTKMQKS